MKCNRLQALLWLHEQLRKGQHFSRRAIEQQFNISSRTARRYIDILRKVFKAPIIYDDKANCYYWVGDSDNIAEV